MTHSVFRMTNGRITAATLVLAVTAWNPAYAEAPAASPPAASSFMGVAINVVNIDKQLAFYTEVLGMKLKTKLPLGMTNEYILGFDADPTSPALLLMHDTAASAPASIQHGNGYSRLVVSVPNLDAVIARLTSLGYSHEGVHEVFNGYRIAMATDPEGYRLELVQRRRAQK